MQYPVSDKMKSLKPSIIREIFKHIADPSIISFAAGSPAPQTLPVNDIKRMLGDALEENPNIALLYSQSEGYPQLRTALKEYLADIMKATDDIIVTSGAQQCMDLFCKVTCNEGDTILCEQPSFVGSLNTFRSYNTKLVGIPMEQDGICVEKLEQALKANNNVRFIYVIPNFQNPTGITMSLQKRKDIYALALKYQVMILEDNPYGDLRFEGEAIPTIKSMDTNGIVVYAGTFSKILSPGIRVGYLVTPTEIIGKIAVAKQCTDVHTSMLSQLLCHKFITTFDVAAHIKNGSRVYAQKCGLMLEQMDKLFPKTVKYTRPSGGLFIWVTLPDGCDSADFCQLMLAKKVAAVPGVAFDCNPDGGKNPHLRFNFSTPTDEQIITGIKITADIMQEIGL